MWNGTPLQGPVTPSVVCDRFTKADTPCFCRIQAIWVCFSSNSSNQMNTNLFLSHAGKRGYAPAAKLLRYHQPTEDPPPSPLLTPAESVTGFRRHSYTPEVRPLAVVSQPCFQVSHSFTDPWSGWFTRQTVLLDRTLRCVRVCTHVCTCVLVLQMERYLISSLTLWVGDMLKGWELIFAAECCRPR